MRKWLSSQPEELSTAAQHTLREHVRQVINHISPRAEWARLLTRRRKRVLLDLWAKWLQLTAGLHSVGALSVGNDPSYRPQWFDQLFLAILVRPNLQRQHSALQGAIFSSATGPNQLEEHGDGTSQVLHDDQAQPHLHLKHGEADSQRDCLTLHHLPVPQQRHYLRLYPLHSTSNAARSQALEQAMSMMRSLGMEPTSYQSQLVLQRTPSAHLFNSAPDVVGASVVKVGTVTMDLSRSLQRLLSPPVTLASAQTTLEELTSPRAPPGPMKNRTRHTRFLHLSATEKCLDELETALLAGTSPLFWTKLKDEKRPELLKEVEPYCQRLSLVMEDGGAAVPTKAQAHALWLLLRDTLLRCEPNSNNLCAQEPDTVHGWNLNDPLELLRLMLGQPGSTPGRRHTDDVLQRTHSCIVRITTAASTRQLFSPIVKMADLINRGQRREELPAIPVGVAKYLAGAICFPDDLVALLPLLLSIQVAGSKEDPYLSSSRIAVLRRQRRRRMASTRLMDIARHADDIGLGHKLEGGSAVFAVEELLQHWGRV